MGPLTSYSSYVGASSGEERFIDVKEGRFMNLLRALLIYVDVDETWYRSKYSDVDEAISNGDLSSAKEHYSRSGYFEDRLPREIEVNEEWYLTTYPDVAEAIAAKKFTSAQQHFYASGFKEGRLPSEAWSL